MLEILAVLAALVVGVGTLTGFLLIVDVLARLDRDEWK